MQLMSDEAPLMVAGTQAPPLRFAFPTINKQQTKLGTDPQ